MTIAMESNSSSSSSSSSSSAPPLSKSRVRVRVRVFTINLPQTSHQAPWIHLVCFFFLFFFITVDIKPATSLSFPYFDSYLANCNHIVPLTNKITSYPRITIRPLQVSRGSFSGGDRILGQTSANFTKHMLFRSNRVSETETEGVFFVRSTLIFRKVEAIPGMQRSQFLLYRRPDITPVQRSKINFLLYGFWSAASGKLCLVGSGSSSSKSGNSLKHNVVFKLNYPNITNIFTSLIPGVLESLDLKDTLNYFEPISILGVADSNYEYTLIETENDNGWFGGNDGKKNPTLGFGPDVDVCSQIVRRIDRIDLNYGNDCDSVNCNPLAGSMDYLPDVMSFDRLRCAEKQRMWFVLGFDNSSYNLFVKPFDARTMFVAEGLWDVNKNVLRAIACRISNYSDSLANAFVGDCSIRLSLSFPATLSIRNMHIAEGKIWSNKSVNDSGYFGRLELYELPSSNFRVMDVPGLKYEYTETDSVRNLCAIKKAFKHKGRIYPDSRSSDLGFDMSVRNGKGQSAQGDMSPLSIGNVFYSPVFYQPVSENQSSSSSSNSPLNISYQITFTPQADFKLGHETLSAKRVKIMAEGFYYTQTGTLCMKGCRHLGSHNQKSTKNYSLDCEVLVNIQYRPLKAKDGGTAKGTIKSTREKSDPLYFDRLELSSISSFTRQAAESIWRMDFEIAMVLISSTLTWLFVGLQLFYVKRHPDVLPFISIVMLIILSLGYMIPLLLNFEAFFLESKQTLLIDSGGWLEVKEVIVRVVTMIAFLLQIRLLQQTWSSRLSDESQTSLWVSEKKVIYLSLPMYIAGGLIAWFVNRRKNSYHSRLFFRSLRNLAPYPLHRQQHSLWGDLNSYGGLVLDGFLLPQIIFNLFFNSKEKALAPSFYIGTTVVRLLPHAYDLYRAHSFSWSFGLSYIYANHRMGLYSTAWDVIIPCIGLLFAVLVYLQQRFGGRCILPKKFRESLHYEMVPVSSTELREKSIQLV